MTPPPLQKTRSIAVIGGGITGIAAAIKLARSGRFNVTLFEKNEHLGGLSASYQWQDVVWDRFYHVMLSTDQTMLDFISDIGLGDQLFWRDTLSGFFSRDRIVSFSSASDFLRFPFLTLWQKFRLGLGILYSSKIKDPSKLDKVYVRQWLTKVFGRRVYERWWDPLLRSKLGDARQKTSAAFIWATIQRLYGARSGGSKKEKMGHVHGGYHTILTAAEERLKQVGVTIRTGSPVTRVSAGAPQKVELSTDGTVFDFDNVLFTVDCESVLSVLSGTGDHSYWDHLRKVEYLGVVCVMLILSRKLSPYYLINLLDESLPFTGIIEATNIVDPGEVGGRHIVYLPKYYPAGHPINEQSDGRIADLFIGKLKKVFPDLKEADILHRRIFRETKVQPLQEIDYLKRTSGFKTPKDGVFLVNTSMIYNSTLNNNAAITLAEAAAKTIIENTNERP